MMTAVAAAVVGWQRAGPGQRILRWWWRAPRLTRGLEEVARRPGGFGTGTTGTGTGPGAGLLDRDRDRVGRQQRRKGKCPGRQQRQKRQRQRQEETQKETQEETQTQTQTQTQTRHPQRNPSQQLLLGRGQKRRRAQPIQPGVVEIGCLVWRSDRKALS
jgi:hypothetical protein